MDDCSRAGWKGGKKNKKTQQQQHALEENRLRSASSIFSSDVPKSLFSFAIVLHNHHSQSSWQLTALSFSLSFSAPHQKTQFLLARKKNANALPCALSLQGQNGRGVNEWQSVLITRRGYLGLVCLISPNAFQLLMLPNCRLHRAGPFITARPSSASQGTGTSRAVVALYGGFVTVWVASGHTHLRARPAVCATNRCIY